MKCHTKIVPLENLFNQGLLLVLQGIIAEEILVLVNLILGFMKERRVGRSSF